MSFVTGDRTCRCGGRTVIRTTWKDANPGRRFQSCLNYENGSCDFFDWYDPPMCRRSKMIIPGLLRKMNEREAEIEMLKLKNEHLVKLDKKMKKMNEREAEIEKLKLKNEHLVKLVKKLKKIVCILVLLLVFIILSKFKVAKENPSGMNHVKMLQ
ncbi:GRF zinc finger containing protein [Striga asiatica]|uniref:GRF zinc finger containing protein n=1 Tax=Striga asiatica TaxID=4170 RepID=A0A5A7QZJ0_STRAF|nr:GRF zinc finger containing protein [Striga asiatica]